jgi:hypothetical protein
MDFADDATPLFNALLAYASASPISLLLDATSGPVDATFFLYHRLRAALRAEPPARACFLALARPAAHHRAALRKFLGPLEARVGIVCGWEVAAAAAAGCASDPAALARALLLAAGAAAAAAAGCGEGPLLLCVEDALGVCELAGGIGEGLAALRALAAAAGGAAPPAALCVRFPARCDWRVPEGGPLLAPSLSSRLEALAGVVLTARDLASGWSADAHGTLEAARGGGGGGAGGEGARGGEPPPAGGAPLLYKVAPDGAVREVGQRARDSA